MYTYSCVASILDVCARVRETCACFPLQAGDDDGVSGPYRP